MKEIHFHLSTIVIRFQEDGQSIEIVNLHFNTWPTASSLHHPPQHEPQSNSDDKVKYNSDYNLIVNCYLFNGHPNQLPIYFIAIKDINQLWQPQWYPLINFGKCLFVQFDSQSTYYPIYCNHKNSHFCY